MKSLFLKVIYLRLTPRTSNWSNSSWDSLLEKQPPVYCVSGLHQAVYLSSSLVFSTTQAPLPGMGTCSGKESVSWKWQR